VILRLAATLILVARNSSDAEMGEVATVSAVRRR
jgi:hypothetical protein